MVSFELNEKGKTFVKHDERGEINAGEKELDT